VDVADIATAGGRSGLACGDAVPLPPGRAGEVAVRLRVPDEIRAGESFELEVLLEGPARVGGYDVTLRLPEGTFEVLAAGPGDVLPGAYGLGPVVDDGTVRFGGYAGVGATSSGEVVLARLRLRPLRTDDVTIEVAAAQVVTDTGGEYAVTADGTVVSPEPWSPPGKAYLPLVESRAGR
jgi:hypothetical protein